MPDLDATIRPLTMPLDSNGHPLPQGTVAEDRALPLSAVLNVTAGSLTTSFADNKSAAIRVDDVGQSVLWVDVTKGTATKIRVQLTFDYQRGGSFTYQQQSASVAAGVSTLKDHTYEYDGTSAAIPILLNGVPWMKVAVAGASGETLTTTTVAVRVTRAGMGA